MEEEEEEDDEKPLVLYDHNYGGVYRIIGPTGYGEGGRVVYKAEYTTDTGMSRNCICMIYVKESDSEAYQNLFSQSLHYYSCYDTTLNRHSHLNDPILGPQKRFRSKGYYCMVFPYMKHGSLLSFMCRRFPRGLPELFILYALFTTLRAVSAIHTQHQRVPFHRQVSAAHIYVDGAAPMLWVMLGYAATVYGADQTSSSTSTSATVWRWAAAPEVYGSDDDATYGAKADIWLVGITALELAYGGLRLESRDELENLITNMQRMRKLPNKLNQEGRHCWTTKGKRASCLGLIPKKRTPTAPAGYEYRPEEWVFSKGFVDLVLVCLDLDPTKRPTATELLRYKIFDTVRHMLYFKL